MQTQEQWGNAVCSVMCFLETLQEGQTQYKSNALAGLQWKGLFTGVMGRKTQHCITTFPLLRSTLPHPCQQHFLASKLSALSKPDTPRAASPQIPLRPQNSLLQISRFLNSKLATCSLLWNKTQPVISFCDYEDFKVLLLAFKDIVSKFMHLCQRSFCMWVVTQCEYGVSTVYVSVCQSFQ